MGAKFQRATQKDVMLPQPNPLPFWPFLNPLQSSCSQQASQGEEQLSPPWEKNMTPSRRNRKTKEQKEHDIFNLNLVRNVLIDNISTENERVFLC